MARTVLAVVSPCFAQVRSNCIIIAMQPAPIVPKPAPTAAETTASRDEALMKAMPMTPEKMMDVLMGKEELPAPVKLEVEVRKTSQGCTVAARSFDASTPSPSGRRAVRSCCELLKIGDSGISDGGVPSRLVLELETPLFCSASFQRQASVGCSSPRLHAVPSNPLLACCSRSLIRKPPCG